MTLVWQRVSELQKQLVDATPLLGARRRRRAARQLTELAHEGSSEAIEALAQAVATGADEAVAEIAATALHSLPEGTARDALCRFAVEEGNEVALMIAAESGYAPSEPPLRSALLALAGRWEELDAFDLDGAYLRVAYEGASPDVRQRVAAAAREAGRLEWVHVAIGGRQRRRLADMIPSEWQDVLILLARPDRAGEAWRLAQEAPPLWGRALLLQIEDSRALPERDREDLAGLRALAARCDEGEVSGSAGADNVATVREEMDSVTSLAMTPDGKLLASGAWDKTIRLWQLSDGECLATLRGHKRGVTCLAAAPDGSLLASGSWDDTIRLWRLPGGDWMATLRGHEGAVESLVITPDGSLLASGSGDGTVRLWHLPDGVCVAALVGHESAISALAITPDGSRLTSGSADGTVRLWTLPGGECVATLRGHASAVRPLTVTLDGNRLASGNSDGTLRLWGSEIATLAATPVAVLAGENDGLKAMRREVGSDERAWLDFMLALVEHHRRFDIQVEAADHVEVGEFDIEIEG